MLNQNVIENLVSSLLEKGLGLGGRIIILLILLFVGIKVIKLAQKILSTTLEKANADKSVATFLTSLTKYGLYGVLAFLIASYCGVDAASIVALVGSIGVAVGLALQGSLSNIAGGVLLLLLRPFNVGDYIIDGTGKEGTVEDIQIFFTKLRTPDNKIIILPNGSLANNTITNVTTSNIRRCDITVGISYRANIKKAKEVLLKLIENDEKVLKDQDMVVFVSELGDSSVNLGVRCWFNNDDYWDGLWRLNEGIKNTLDMSNIEIPYPQLDVHVVK